MSNRCSKCRLRLCLCVCDVVEPMTTQTRVSVLMHYRELTLGSNSAKLLPVALTNAEIRVRGLLNTPTPIEGLLAPDRQPVFLFPSSDSHILTREWALALGKPITLIIPDGSWRQAKRVGRREEVLRDVPHVRLPPGPPSRYRLRREPQLEYVSTFEAAARALGILEGDEIQRELERFFDIAVERQLWNRGLLPLDQCNHPIPQPAIDEFYVAGCRSRL